MEGALGDDGRRGRGDGVGDGVEVDEQQLEHALSKHSPVEAVRLDWPGRPVGTSQGPLFALN